MRGKKQPLLALRIVTGGAVLVSIFLMLPMSQKVWEWVSPLQYLQYPWRLLSLTIPASGLCAAYIASRTKHTWIAIVIALASVLVSRHYVRPVVYAPRNDAYYLSRKEFTDGTSSLGNSFSTIWTGWKATRPASDVSVDRGEVSEKIRWSYLDREFTVSMQKDGTVTVSTLYFPGWMVAVDGSIVPIDYQKDGIIRFPASEGTHDVRVYFIETLVRKIAGVISVVSLAILGACAILAL